ncbi:MAG: hypothetical protein WBQ53_07275 [Methylocystis sp.]
MSASIAPSFDTPRPPKPRYCVRVGVTGHPPDQLRQKATPRARDDLLSLFAAIETAAVRNLESTSQWYESSKPAIRLVSSLAEGSDQLAAEIVAREFRARADEGQMRPRAADWSIDAVLPAPKGDYVAASRVSARSEPGQPIDVAGQFLAAFALADRLVELPLLTHDGRSADGGDKPGPRPGGSQTSQPLDPAKTLDHHLAARFMVWHIDVLVAVWNREPGSGPGGTAEVARLAFESGVPVIVVDPEGSTPPRRLIEIDERGAGEVDDADCRRAGMFEEIFSTLFAIPIEADSEHSNGGEEPDKLLKGFLAESWPKNRGPATFDLLKTLASGRWPRHFLRLPIDPQGRRQDEWDNFLKEVSPGPALDKALREKLLPRFVFADELAILYANKYRSAYLSVYFWAAVAVWVALLGFAPQTSLDPLSFKLILAVIEICIIVYISLKVRFGRGMKWHRRWLDYRALAETLRHVRFLACAGMFGGKPTAAEERSAWWLWYLRATMREIGPPDGQLDAAAIHAILWGTRTEELQPQREYHKGVVRVFERIEHIIHRMELGIVTLTVLVLASFVVTVGWYWFDQARTTGDYAFVFDEGEDGPMAWVYQLKPWVSIIAAGLPAVGAALGGIKFTGEFRSTALRSTAMVNAIDDLEEHYDAMLRGTKFKDARRLLLSTASVLAEDINAFRAIFGQRNLTLPA